MKSACAVLYCHLWPVRLCHIIPHLINATIFGKNLLNVFSTTFASEGYVMWHSFLLSRHPTTLAKAPGISSFSKFLLLSTLISVSICYTFLCIWWFVLPSFSFFLLRWHFYVMSTVLRLWCVYQCRQFTDIGPKPPWLDSFNEIWKWGKLQWPGTTECEETIELYLGCSILAPW
jgi:hypothetical protein